MQKKMKYVDNWSELPSDLLVDIANKQEKIEDFTAMRGVCTWWRAATTKDTFKGLSLDKTPPLVMLAKNKNDERELYSLFTREIRKPAIPEAKGKRCMDARFGWILAVAPRGGHLYLFNPFSSSRIIQLPNFHTFPGYAKYKCDPEVMFVRRAILTANPSMTSKFMVFVRMNYVLGFWKNGDKKWTRIRMEPGIPTNIGYGSQKMYATDDDSRLWSWDPSATDLTHMQPAVQTLWVRPDLDPTAPRMHYVVELIDGWLLVIVRCLNRWSFLCVKETDLSKVKWVRTNYIGKDAIFIDQDAAVSVAADDFPGVIKPNSVYCFDLNNQGQGKEVCICDIKDGTYKTIPIESSCSTCPPFWVFP